MTDVYDAKGQAYPPGTKGPRLRAVTYQDVLEQNARALAARNRALARAFLLALLYGDPTGAIMGLRLYHKAMSSKPGTWDRSQNAISRLRKTADLPDGDIQIR